LNMVNNIDYLEPRITIKRDVFLKDTFGEDVVVSSLKLLPEEIEKRNTKEVCASPIQLRYEWKYCSNLTLIDTPGISIQDTETTSERTKIIIEICKVPQRWILFVESAADWDSIKVFEFLKKIDLTSSRTIIVFNQFFRQLSKFSNQNDLSQYLTKKPSDIKCFFTSLFPSMIRDECLSKPELLAKYVVQAWKRDMDTLEALKFDKRDNNFIGIGSVRTYILELSWKSLKDMIPELKKQLSSAKKTSSETLKKLQEQLLGLDFGKLRSLISNYVADWLQVIVHLMDGSSEGNAQITGQTEEEENIASEIGNWPGYKHSIPTNSETIRSFEEKLYGGPQFERMLIAFRMVMSRREITEIRADELEEAIALTIKEGYHISGNTDRSNAIAKVIYAYH